MEGDEIMYKECQRNHAASLGSYATDGCGEFDPSPAAALTCAACGCHRNFHRKVTSTSQLAATTTKEWAAAEIMERRPEGSSSKKKRFRTKFSDEQKEKMVGFAEKLGWRLQRKDLEDEIERFCRGIGITRKVFKVWMHNHKNNSASSLTDQ